MHFWIIQLFYICSRIKFNINCIILKNIIFIGKIKWNCIKIAFFYFTLLRLEFSLNSLIVGLLGVNDISMSGPQLVVYVFHFFLVNAQLFAIPKAIIALKIILSWDRRVVSETILTDGALKAVPTRGLIQVEIIYHYYVCAIRAKGWLDFVY